MWFGLCNFELSIGDGNYLLTWTWLWYWIKYIKIQPIIGNCNFHIGLPVSFAQLVSSDRHCLLASFSCREWRWEVEESNIISHVHTGQLQPSSFSVPFMQCSKSYFGGYAFEWWFVTCRGTLCVCSRTATTPWGWRQIEIFSYVRLRTATQHGAFWPWPMAFKNFSWASTVEISEGFYYLHHPTRLLWSWLELRVKRLWQSNYCWMVGARLIS